MFYSTGGSSPTISLRCHVDSKKNMIKILCIASFFCSIRSHSVFASAFRKVCGVILLTLKTSPPGEFNVPAAFQWTSYHFPFFISRHCSLEIIFSFSFHHMHLPHLSLPLCPLIQKRQQTCLKFSETNKLFVELWLARVRLQRQHGCFLIFTALGNT